MRRRGDLLVGRPPPDLFGDHGLAQTPRIFDRRSQHQCVAVVRPREPFHDAQLIAVLRVPPCDTGCHSRRLDDQRVTFETSHGVTEPAGRTGRSRATIEVDRAYRFPFAVAEIDPIVTDPADLQLMRRKHLLRESPRLTAKEPRIVRRIERYVSELPRSFADADNYRFDTSRPLPGVEGTGVCRWRDRRATRSAARCPRPCRKRSRTSPPRWLAIAPHPLEFRRYARRRGWRRRLRAGDGKDSEQDRCESHIAIPNRGERCRARRPAGIQPCILRHPPRDCCSESTLRER